MMLQEQMLAGLQEEVQGLAETVQRLSSENETLKTQSTSGAVRTVTMANEVAWLNQPAAFSGADVLRVYDGRHVVEGATSSGIWPKGEANLDRRSRKRESTHAQQYLGTADDTSQENGARSTRPKRVRSVPKARSEIREQRRARRNSSSQTC